MPKMLNRVVVLGGGGPGGLAWMTGYLHAISTRVNLTQYEDMVVLGTSAGATAGVLLLNHGAIRAAYLNMLREETADRETNIPRRSRNFSAEVGRILPEARDEAAYSLLWADVALRSEYADRQLLHRERIDTIRMRLGEICSWPQKSLQIVSLQASTGERVILDSNSKVPLFTAIASASAVPGMWPPVDVRLGDREETLFDAGVLSDTNVDLVGQARRLLVIQPTPNLQGPRDSEAPARARALVVEPDRSSASILHGRLMDPDVQRAAARAGFVQGIHEAERLDDYWTSKNDS